MGHRIGHAGTGRVAEQASHAAAQQHQWQGAGCRLGAQQIGHAVDPVGVGDRARVWNLGQPVAGQVWRQHLVPDDGGQRRQGPQRPRVAAAAMQQQQA